MSNTIQLKRSSTPGAAPSAMLPGELAINLADGELYYLTADDEIKSLLEIDCGIISPPAVASALSLWRAESLDSNWHWST